MRSYDVSTTHGCSDPWMPSASAGRSARGVREQELQRFRRMRWQRWVGWISDWRLSACLRAAVALGTAIASAPAHGVGEAVNGFPNWRERVIHQWINRARVDPQVEMAACGGACGEAACYTPIAPLSWNLPLNRAARFHSDTMLRQSFFSHTSACTVVSNINSLYPDSCNGSAACACVGGTTSCSSTCTSFSSRIQLFGGSPYGEIIATPTDPNTAFYLWLFEPAGTTCSFTSQNGHRWLILKATNSVGVGVSGPAVGDFGNGSAPTKIPSGAHYPQQAATVNAWVNWYDTAAPQSASVNVAGQCSPMSLGRGTPQNGAYHAALTGFSAGCHRYYFSFVDSGGAPVTFPTTGSLAIGTGGSCPDWDSSRPPDCGAAPTSTATLTLTPSLTPTRSPTAAATATRTLTPTPSLSPTRTPTRTPTTALFTVSGTVTRYGSGLPLAGAAVRFKGPTGEYDIATDAAGGFSAQLAAGNWEIRPRMAAGSGGPVDEADAAAVLGATVGMISMPAEIALAADVSGSGRLSGFDAALILRRAEGNNEPFPAAVACGSDWALVPEPVPVANQVVTQPVMSLGDCTLGAVSYLPLNGNASGQNFTAARFGNVDGP